MSTAFKPEPVFFFDLAGVLLKWDPSDVYAELFHGEAHRHSFFFTEVLDTPTLHKIATSRDSRQVMQDLIAKHPSFTQPIEAFWSRWDEMVSDAFPETVALTRELRENAWQTNLLGNWSRDEFDRAVRRYDFLTEFEHAIISGDHGVMKPDPRFFEIALERLKLSPAQCIFIDDTPANVEAAEQIGFTAIQFTDAKALRIELVQLGILEA